MNKISLEEKIKMLDELALYKTAGMYTYDYFEALKHMTGNTYFSQIYNQYFSEKDELLFTVVDNIDREKEEEEKIQLLYLLLIEPFTERMEGNKWQCI